MITFTLLNTWNTQSSAGVGQSRTPVARVLVPAITPSRRNVSCVPLMPPMDKARRWNRPSLMGVLKLTLPRAPARTRVEEGEHIRWMPRLHGTSEGVYQNNNEVAGIRSGNQRTTSLLGTTAYLHHWAGSRRGADWCLGKHIRHSIALGLTCQSLPADTPRCPVQVAPWQ